LLHPLLPFVTEEIYSKLPNVHDKLLIQEPYPIYTEKLFNEKAEKDFEFLQELVRQVRTLRSECTIPPGQKVRVSFKVSQGKEILEENKALVKLLAGIGQFDLTEVSNQTGPKDGGEKPAGAIGLVGNGYEAFVFIAEAVDIKLLKQKFVKDLERDTKYMEGLKSKVANENFVKNAPPELVAEEKNKLNDCLERTGKLQSYIRNMA
jgi:valyl-tRNA synthetase